MCKHPSIVAEIRAPRCHPICQKYSPCLGMCFNAVGLARLKTGRVGVFRGRGARYGRGTIILDSGELPHEFWYPPPSLADREIPRDPISPHTYARSRTRRVRQPAASTKGSWPPSWSHHHPPLPSFLKLPNRGSLVREFTKHHQGGTIGVRTLCPALGPSWQASLLLRWSLCDARSSPASLLAIILGKVLTLGAFRIPAAPKVLHRLLVFAVGLPSIWVITRDS